MKYDFTTILDRKGKDSIAVEPFEADWIKWPGKTKEGFDIIPMWVADMNFPAVHTIPEAIIERTNILPMVTFLQEKNILTLSSSGIRPEMA